MVSPDTERTQRPLYGDLPLQQIEISLDAQLELYGRERTIENRNCVVEIAAKKAFELGKKFIASSGQRVFGAEELSGVIAEALIEAVEKFNLSLGVKFNTYLAHIIQGRIKDEFRKSDPLGRRDRGAIRKLENFEQAYQQRTGQRANDAEVMAGTGFSFARIEALRELVKLSRPLSLSAPMTIGGEDENGISVEDKKATQQSKLSDAEREEFWSRLCQPLNSTQRAVLLAYARDGTVMRDVGRQLGLTESRVCQIVTETAVRLREYIKADPYFAEVREIILKPRRQVRAEASATIVGAGMSFAIVDDTQSALPGKKALRGASGLESQLESLQLPPVPAVDGAFTWIDE